MRASTCAYTGKEETDITVLSSTHQNTKPSANLVVGEARKQDAASPIQHPHAGSLGGPTNQLPA